MSSAPSKPERVFADMDEYLSFAFPTPETPDAPEVSPSEMANQSAADTLAMLRARLSA